MNDSRSMLDHLLVPIASVEDARQTAAALEPYSLENVTVLYVVPQQRGAIDPVPSSHYEEEAEESFDVFLEAFPNAVDHLSQGEDLIETIYDVAEEVDATAIAYHSRGGNRLVKLLSGDQAQKLIDDPPLPVISLPTNEEIPTE